ncbi:hypothetical protein [Achromobacter sp. NCFB-sbj8-Ac1-l]|uniref:hypothetical protein n=1 Tax=unclassified Achromobacter TaxID=2626865 RepID=UPI004046D952
MSISVHDFLKKKISTELELNSKNFEIEGWLTTKGGDLILIENEQIDDNCVDENIIISNFEIIYAIRDRILPLAGGRSFLFHKAKIVGKLVGISPPTVFVEKLRVCERNSSFLTIDISNNSIESGKGKYGDQLLGNKKPYPVDWLDEFL